jgi:hypothetical protein
VFQTCLPPIAGLGRKNFGISFYTGKAAATSSTEKRSEHFEHKT